MNHLYLRTIDVAQRRPGQIAWILTCGDTAALTGQTRMWSGFSMIQDEADCTLPVILLDALTQVDRWLDSTQAETLPMF